MMFFFLGGRGIWRTRSVKIAEIRRPFRIDSNKKDNRDKYIFGIRKNDTRHNFRLF